jgi:hypothetical protein
LFSKLLTAACGSGIQAYPAPASQVEISANVTANHQRHRAGDHTRCDSISRHHLTSRDVRGFHPRVWRLFDLLENTARHCPAGCHKFLPIAALMVHLNDDHHWSREQIAEWIRGGLHGP